jgi:hypothetical protein
MGDMGKQRAMWFGVLWLLAVAACVNLLYTRSYV